MAQPKTVTIGDREYAWPLAGYEDAPALPDEKTEDGKSYKNNANESLSKAYDEFPDPLKKDRRGGFDVHIYYFQSNESQTKYAHALWARIRHEFPELRIYRLWDKPLGPHPVAMFEVNVFTPAQFGAFIPWLSVWRGPLSALVHPNSAVSGEDSAVGDLRDHTERAIWMGEKILLDTTIFRKAAAASTGGQ